MGISREQVQQQIQTNCHISDARHASDYTLCIYLLKMREFFRWENNRPYHEPLPHEDVGSWLSEREQLWDELEQQDFQNIKTTTNSHDPFSVDDVNRELIPEGLIYSAGYGLKHKPLFFLGELENKQQRDGYTVYISGRDLARDLTAPPAMSQNTDIYVRRESLRRIIWEKTEEWGWHQNRNAMFNAMNCYDFASEPEESLNQMTDNELESAILHEVGEIKSSEILGEDWKQLLLNLPRSQAEIMARAAKDLLADSLTTLPALIEKEATASIHFYFANFTHMRKEIAPSMLDAYEIWRDTGNLQALKQATADSQIHWSELIDAMIKLYQKYDVDSVPRIVDLVKNNTF